MKTDQRRKGKKRKKNLEAKIVMAFFTVIFFSMIVYLCIFVKQNEQSMLNNSYNSRQKKLAQMNTRGMIFDSEGNVLAKTVTGQDKKEERQYPYGSLYSHVVGYSTNGKTGIESIANYYLIQSDMSLSKKVENDVAGKKNQGNDVYTTLNGTLQKIAYDSLGAYKGAVIVSDVKTGKILAMVSKPDFDPNTVVEDWDDYVADTKNAVLLNRVTQGLYPPGSTFKIITALAYIRENQDSFLKYQYTCNGQFQSGTTTINCFHGAKHGQLNLLTSFAKSCNSSFANIGIGLDREKYSKLLDDMLFNQNLPLDFNYSKSRIAVDSNTSDEEMVQLAIGQGKAQITPIHLNMITNAIANHGVLMKPMILDRVVSADQNVIKSYKSEEYTELLSERESEILTNMMVSVVQEGTATKLKNNLYSAAGKTGSAEYNGVKADSHAWFTGFAPADDPQISVTVIIEGIGSGGDYAVPIAKRIFDGYFTE